MQKLSSKRRNIFFALCVMILACGCSNVSYEDKKQEEIIGQESTESVLSITNIENKNVTAESKEKEEAAISESESNFKYQDIDELEVGYVTQEDILQIGRMQSLTSLKISIDDANIDLSPLAGLYKLENLEIQSRIGSCYDLDIQPLGKLTALKSLTMYECSFDMSFLAELNQLREVSFLKCDNVKSLVFFKDMSELRHLYITYVDDSNLDDLQKLKNLEELYIIGGNIRNFEGLKELENVKELCLVENEKSYDGERQTMDLEVLLKMKNLENIAIEYINIEDLGPLSQMEKLQIITLVKTGIDSIMPLKDLENLTTLNVFGNESTEVEEQAEKYFADVRTWIDKKAAPYSY